MADLPILFSAPMVRALIREIEQPGQGKTQTRRTIKSARVFATPESKAFTLRGDQLTRALQGAARFRRLDGNGWFWEADAFDYQFADRTGWMAYIGYAPGDRLYVREAWRTSHRLDAVAPRDLLPNVSLFFEADPRPPEPGEPYGDLMRGRFRQGMHMPRWASRLTLSVTDVRVERLQDISEQDAWAEGCAKGDPDDVGGFFPSEEPDPSGIGYRGWDNARDWYADLWDQINGDGAWASNPWVAAYTFTVALGNIDQLAVAA